MITMITKKEIKKCQYILEIIEEIRCSSITSQKQKEKIENTLYDVYGYLKSLQRDANINIAMIKALQKKINYLEKDLT